MKNETLTEKLIKIHLSSINLMPIPSQDASTNVEGRLVKGRLERGKDGIKRMYTITPKDKNYYEFTQNEKGEWEAYPPITIKSRSK